MITNREHDNNDSFAPNIFNLNAIYCSVSQYTIVFCTFQIFKDLKTKLH